MTPASGAEQKECEHQLRWTTKRSARREWAINFKRSWCVMLFASRSITTRAQTGHYKPVWSKKLMQFINRQSSRRFQIMCRTLYVRLLKIAGVCGRYNSFLNIHIWAQSLTTQRMAGRYWSWVFLYMCILNKSKMVHVIDRRGNSARRSIEGEETDHRRSFLLCLYCLLFFWRTMQSVILFK